jgi:hypothetical protein
LIARSQISARQAGNACGALDVSGQVTVSRQALLIRFLSANDNFTEQFQLTNQGASVPGPVYLVLDGMCSTIGYCPFANGFAWDQTTCFAPFGMGTFSPMLLVSSGGIAAGQTLYFDARFYGSPYATPFSGPGVPEGNVTTRVFSGHPNQ